MVLRDVKIVEHMNQVSQYLPPVYVDIEVNLHLKLYSDLNISVALVGVVTWTERDLIDIPNDMDPVKVLTNFKDYYYRIPGHFDCAILIS